MKYHEPADLHLDNPTTVTWTVKGDVIAVLQLEEKHKDK